MSNNCRDYVTTVKVHVTPVI